MNVDFIEKRDVIMEEIKLNSHCVNAKIKYHILSDEKMKEIGFHKNYYEGTDHEEYSPYWWLARMILGNKRRNICKILHLFPMKCY